MEIFLIDGIGPFFRGLKKRRINWSKVPFQHLKKNPEKRKEQFAQIRIDMAVFVSKVKSIGYNSISLDDVAHLVTDKWHSDTINEEIETYQQEYRSIFSLIKAADMDIYLNMDILTYTEELRKEIDGCVNKATDFLKRQLEGLFTTFPEIAGVILRIGECDGKDVKGEFRSELLLQNAGQVNRLLHDLIPLCEQHGKKLILRTWTVGAYRIGDLIWHRKTTARVLRGIDSDNFILSMKYGESDYFRYLPLNKSFFRFNCRKIIELQARREYEGCGEYPSFIGWDYYNYATELRDVQNMAGISVWCQTGGWVPFRRLTYLEPSGIWNELNSYVTLRLFKDQMDVEAAVESFAAQIGCSDLPLLLEFLKLNDEVIKELLYISEVADKKLFFRRVRIPPLLTVFWNNIFINHSVRKVLLSLVASPERSVEEGERALAKLEEMYEIAEKLELPAVDIRYMAETFKILALARQYYFRPYGPEVRKSIKEAKQNYKKFYPKGSRPRYRIKTNYQPFPIRRRHVAMVLRFSLRRKRGYRIIDYLFTLHLLGILFRFVVSNKPKIIPKFARKQAMGIGAIFR